MAAAYQQCRDPRTGALGGTIMRVADSAFIPDDPANLDWQQYQAWLDEGHTPDPSEPLPATDPSVASSIEARLAALTERIEACEARLALLEGRTS